MRSVCAPELLMLTTVPCDSQYAVFCQPQPLRLLAVLSVARFTSSPLVESVWYAAVPLTSALENCTQNESLYFELFSPRMRNHRRYGTPAVTLSGTST